MASGAMDDRDPTQTCRSRGHGPLFFSDLRPPRTSAQAFDTILQFVTCTKKRHFNLIANRYCTSPSGNAVYLCATNCISGTAITGYTWLITPPYTAIHQRPASAHSKSLWVPAWRTRYKPPLRSGCNRRSLLRHPVLFAAAQAHRKPAKKTGRPIPQCARLRPGRNLSYTRWRRMRAGLNPPQCPGPDLHRPGCHLRTPLPGHDCHQPAARPARCTPFPPSWWWTCQTATTSQDSRRYPSAPLPGGFRRPNSPLETWRSECNNWHTPTNRAGAGVAVQKSQHFGRSTDISSVKTFLA